MVEDFTLYGIVVLRRIANMKKASADRAEALVVSGGINAVLRVF